LGGDHVAPLKEVNMPEKIIPFEPNYEDWIEQIDIPNLVGEVGDLTEYVPYVKYVFGAYRWFKTLRAKHFLRALSKSAEKMDEEDKSRLQDILKSKEGAEILADYVDVILRTSSKSAIAALALLYSDVKEQRYSLSFKLAAITVLEGISEQSIDAFLELLEVNTFIPNKNQSNVPYPVAVASDDLINSLNSPVRELLKPPETRITIISDLIRRGLLLPDFVSSRWSDGDFYLTFGVSEEVKKYADLIRKARQLLPNI
jgi:hypothetical protein